MEIKIKEGCTYLFQDMFANVSGIKEIECKRITETSYKLKNILTDRYFWILKKGLYPNEGWIYKIIEQL